MFNCKTDKVFLAVASLRSWDEAHGCHVIVSPCHTYADQHLTTQQVHDCHFILFRAGDKYRVAKDRFGIIEKHLVNDFTLEQAIAFYMEAVKQARDLA